MKLSLLALLVVSGSLCAAVHPDATHKQPDVAAIIAGCVGGVVVGMALMKLYHARSTVSLKGAAGAAAFPVQSGVQKHQQTPAQRTTPGAAFVAGAAVGLGLAGFSL